MNADIVARNLKMMFSSEEGGMWDLLIGESIGGNAGHYGDGFESGSCAAANFYFDDESGDIKYFGNWQNVPENIRGHYPQGTLRCAMSGPLSGQIVEPLLNDRVIDGARSNLLSSVDVYNALYKMGVTNLKTRDDKTEEERGTRKTFFSRLRRGH
tara:strand:+ start:769 stop:1233 length:465 start_codon:yes stop_codon:yes gene_type:complete